MAGPQKIMKSFQGLEQDLINSITSQQRVDNALQESVNRGPKQEGEMLLRYMPVHVLLADEGAVFWGVAKIGIDTNRMRQLLLLQSQEQEQHPPGHLGGDHSEPAHLRGPGHEPHLLLGAPYHRAFADPQRGDRGFAGRQTRGIRALAGEPEEGGSPGAGRSVDDPAGPGTAGHGRAQTGPAAD